MSRNASQEFLVSDDSKTRDKLNNGLGELRRKFQKFYNEYETSQHEISQQKKTIKENSDKLAELVQLKLEMDRYKERLSISETQNYDKDVIIGELKLQLDKFKTEKDAKIIELKKQIEELVKQLTDERREKYDALTELKELKFQQKRIALVPPMNMPSPKKVKKDAPATSDEMYPTFRALQASKTTICLQEKVTERNVSANSATETIMAPLSFKKSTRKVRFNEVNEERILPKMKEYKMPDKNDTNDDNNFGAVKSCQSLIGIPSLSSLLDLSSSANNRGNNNYVGISGSGRRDPITGAALITTGSSGSNFAPKSILKPNLEKADHSTTAGAAEPRPFLWSLSPPKTFQPRHLR